MYAEVSIVVVSIVVIHIAMVLMSHTLQRAMCRNKVR